MENNLCKYRRLQKSKNFRILSTRGVLFCFSRLVDRILTLQLSSPVFPSNWRRFLYSFDSKRMARELRSQPTPSERARAASQPALSTAKKASIQRKSTTRSGSQRKWVTFRSKNTRPANRSTPASRRASASPSEQSSPSQGREQT